MSDQPTPESRRIVVVEDNADAREALRALLELDGHRVDVASDGQQGLERVLAVRPDVAFVDIGLPGMDGYEMARKVRATAEGRGVRLIALTGYGRVEDRRLAREAGFDGHLVKPLDPQALAQLLQSVDRPSGDP